MADKDKDKLFNKEEIPADETHYPRQIKVKGVPPPWFAELLDMDIADVRQKLQMCPHVGLKQSAKLYLPKDAMPFLTPPKIDIKKELAKMRQKDFPKDIFAQYWNGMKAKADYEERANELFYADDVMTMMVLQYRLIRDRIQMAQGEMTKKVSLNDMQRKFLVQYLDTLQKDILDRLTEFADQHVTPTILETFENETREVTTKSAAESSFLTGVTDD